MADVPFTSPDERANTVTFQLDYRAFVVTPSTATDVPINKIYGGAGVVRYVMRGYLISTTTLVRWSVLGLPDETGAQSPGGVGTLDRIAVDARIPL